MDKYGLEDLASERLKNVQRNAELRRTRAGSGSTSLARAVDFIRKRISRAPD